MFGWLNRKENAKEKEIETFKATIETLETIIRNLFHEAVLPMRSLEYDLDNLSKQMINKDRTNLSNALSNFERLKAIFSLSMDLYTGGAGSILNSDKHSRISNLNTLTQQAIMASKAVLKDMHFSVNYSANCHIDCIPTEVIQMLVTLFKNAYEAYENTDSHKEIFVRTYHKRPAGAANRTVCIEIEDHASGIDPIIAQYVWRPGFTTKHPKFGGIGLDLVNETANRYAGITCESPVIKNGVEVRGTKFTLSFKRSDVKTAKDE